jgi:osmotically-inducible protein OsmY
VQLSGFVASGDAKRHAESLAKDVDGVKQVENDINVRD